MIAEYNKKNVIQLASIIHFIFGLHVDSVLTVNEGTGTRI